MIFHEFPKHVHRIPGNDVTALLTRLAYYNQGENPYLSGYVNGSNWRFNVGDSKGGILIMSIPKSLSISRVSIVFRHKRNGVENMRSLYVTFDKLTDERNITIPIAFYQEIGTQCYADKALGVYTNNSDYSFDIIGGGTGISVTYVDMTLDILNGTFDPFEESMKLTAKNFHLADKQYGIVNESKI